MPTNFFHSAWHAICLSTQQQFPFVLEIVWSKQSAARPPQYSINHGWQGPPKITLEIREPRVALKKASRMCVDNYGILGGHEIKSYRETRMHKDPDETDSKKPHLSTPEETVMAEIIQAIETVDRKIEEFYAVHGTEIQVIHDDRYGFRRLK
jgi:hypothetical protein